MSAAGEAARELGDEYVSTEHLLIGLASADSAPGSVGATLARAGATRKALLAALPGVRGNARVTSPDPEGTYNALDKYSLDLTAAAREGRLDPVIGPRRGDPAGDPGAVPADEEQPRADR
jgi:ATP-dependent Clp protease ATP-binding subunit ClpB